MSVMIGVYGGTFDPIHFGHLRPVLDVVEALNIEKCHFIPCSIPHHRALPTASSTQRLEMIAAAIKDEPRFYLDSIEIDREGVSYTVDTIESLVSMPSINIDTSENETLCLIVGIDAFVNFDQWHRWQDILKLTHVVVTHRPGWDVETLLKTNKISVELAEVITNRRIMSDSELGRYHSGKIYFKTVTQLDISSSNIRALLADRQSINYLLPDTVISIIKNQNIYVK